ncbi:MAG: hypothetical protein KJO55_05590, partial [Gammaproteobacteria bacterium]|nr:hypothetical protein [Gammaproteobacteria bacterium]
TGLTLDLDLDFPTTVVLGDDGTILGGTLAGTSVTLPTSTMFTLDGVTLAADILVDAAADLRIENGLVMSGSTITLASNNSFTYLRFEGANGATSNLGGSGEVLFAGTTTLDNRNRIEVVGNGHGLNIGSGITVRSTTAGGEVRHFNANGPITIDGTLRADLSGHTVSVIAYPLTINGTLDVLNDSKLVANFAGSTAGSIDAGATLTVNTGELELVGDFSNAAAISVTDGLLDIGSSNDHDWSNSGSITLNNSTLELGGSYTRAAAGTINGSGTVVLDGILDNTGLTIDLGTDFPTTVELGDDGTILGGTINGTVVTLPASTTFTLDGVTLGTDIAVEPAGDLRVQNGLVMTGSTITLASNNSFTYLRFEGSDGTTSTLGGSGEVLLAGTTTIDNRNRIEVVGNGHGLVIGSGITVRSTTSGGEIRHFNSNGLVTMDGTVRSDLANRTVTITGFPLTVNGTLEVLNDAELTANFSGSTPGSVDAGATLSVNTGELELFGDFVNGATISVVNGVLDIGNSDNDDWSSTGSISLTNGTVELGGSYTRAGAGTITGTGSVVLDGLLDNTGLTLDLDTDFPTTVALGDDGEITGGTVNGTNTSLAAGTTFTLNAVTLGADITVEPASDLRIQNDLVMAGSTITLASNNSFTYLRLEGANGDTSTLGGTGEVLFGGTTTIDNRNRIEAVGSGHGLLIDSGIIVRTTTSGGEIRHFNSNGAITIDGSVRSETATRSVGLNGFPLTINGNLQADVGTEITMANYTLGSSATVDVEIGGTAQSDYGRLISSAVGNLAGTLNISTVSFSPTLSDTFEIMSFATRNGTFGTVNGSAIGGGLSYQVNYNPGDVTLEVIN